MSASARLALPLLPQLRESGLNRSWRLWLIALVITLVAAYYQRVTGPTYSVSGSATLGAVTFHYRLERTHASAGDHRVRLEPHDPATQGVLEWRTLAGDRWTATAMTREGDVLVGAIPAQPIASRVAYRVRITNAGREIVLPERAQAVLRFRGDVPWWALVPHILAMFAAMLYSTRAGLETLSPKPEYRMLVFRTIAALIVGGIVLGCLVAWYAFRSPWGGFPISNDPTDNKTLLALVLWLAAAGALRTGGKARPWVTFASVLTLLIYMIPHSVSMPK